MDTQILATKLYKPPPRSHVVLRPRLTERLNEGLRGKLTLLSAPAGFGKTTLISEWLTSDQAPAAWLSLDEADNDLARFLAYLVAALRSVAPRVGEGVMSALQGPQPPPAETVLTTVLNDMAGVPQECVLVLDDYHVIDSKPIDDALTFLLDHLPPNLRVVIATREDPRLPMARLRAGSQMTELRAADLRFTVAEATGFLNHAMGLSLSHENVAALEARTEGWIAGLQLAAISLRGSQDTDAFIASFSGSHHFVMDYLMEEVLQRQAESVQSFLLRTSILDRLCGPLCDAVTLAPSSSGQATLRYLERANLFTVPLDDERRWYRYHHLFADLLRQRLAAPAESDGLSVAELHQRASQWFEDNGLYVDAFQHAVAAYDTERAARLLEDKDFPLHFRGVVTVLLNWLGSLPKDALDARPELWVNYAGLMLVNGQTTGVDEKLRAGEAALRDAEPNERTRHLLGRIAATWATLALTRYQVDVMIAQSQRALEYLPAGDLSMRANAHWTLAFAYFLSGERAASRQAVLEGIALARAAEDIFTTLVATAGLGAIQEVDNELREAVETYQSVLRMGSQQPLQIVSEAQLGLARILYEWNDLDAAEQIGQQSYDLSRQYDRVIDRYIICQVFLARVQMARGDVAGAVAALEQIAKHVRERGFVHRAAEVAAARVVAVLRLGDLDTAAQLAEETQLPLTIARVRLAQGDPSAALAQIEPWLRQAETRNWPDERLRSLALRAMALEARGDTDEALSALGVALALAEPAGCVRTFVDEGPPMARLLSLLSARGAAGDFLAKLLSAFDTSASARVAPSNHSTAAPTPPSAPRQPLVEPLSHREVEVLQLIAQGLSNHEICARLYLALDTVKGHNRKIFEKLRVQRRTEAVARARELGLL